MYSNIKSVQILIALLKKYEIKDIILSPGGSDVPIIHSIETDDYFNCFSVVDERNATYFAMGLAQERNKPVACVCTSGSAICNYLPGITEAFYQNVPIVAITADKNPYFQGQLETQKIDQMNTFSNVVKKSVSLPIINNQNDYWLCNRLVNEALLELSHHGTGPVHINIPIVGDTTLFLEKELPKERVIKILEEPIMENIWKNISNELSQKNKIMVVVGQNIRFSKEDIKNLNSFFEKYNCFFAIEHLSNLECNGTIKTYPITEMGGLNETLIPDLVISIGNNLSAYKLKPFLRENYKSIENWLIDPSGKVRDSYKCLTNIFECTVSEFFKKINENYIGNNKNNMQYYNQWKAIEKQIKLPDFEFSNFYVASKLSEIIKENSILHLAILNSTRIMQFFDLNKNIHTYSNVGTLGIDGCLATFAGQAAATENKAFLLIGDLSFFYGMNATALRSIKNNVRIILLNNSGGSEFQFFIGKERIETIDNYICAKHSHSAKGWITSLGYEYYSASSKEELDKVINVLGEDSEKPIFLEVFTDMKIDADKTNDMYNSNKFNFGVKKGGISGVKDIIETKISIGNKQKIKKIMNYIHKVI